MVDTNLSQYLEGAFNFEYECGAKFKVNPDLKDKYKIVEWFKKSGELSEEENEEKLNLYVKTFQNALPEEPEKNIKTFLMMHEDETTFHFLKHFNYVKVKDGETYTPWNERVIKEFEEKEGKKKD